MALTRNTSFVQKFRCCANFPCISAKREIILVYVNVHVNLYDAFRIRNLVSIRCKYKSLYYFVNIVIDIYFF